MKRGKAKTMANQSYAFADSMVQRTAPIGALYWVLVDCFRAGWKAARRQGKRGRSK